MARVLVQRGTSEFRRKMRSETRLGFYGVCYAVVGAVAHIYCRVPFNYRNNKSKQGKGEDTYWWLATVNNSEAAVEWCERKLLSTPVAIPASWVVGNNNKPLPQIPAELKGGFWSKLRGFFNRKAA